MFGAALRAVFGITPRRGAGIEVVGTTGAAKGTESMTITGTLPTNSVGDLLAVMAAIDDTGQNSAFDTPSGWTAAFIDDSSNLRTLFALFYKPSTGGETSVTVTWTGINEKSVLRMISLSGVDLAAPVNLVGTASNGVDASVETNDLTTTVDVAFVLGCITRDGSELTFTPAASWSDRGVSGSGNPNGVTGYLCSRTAGAAGPIGTFVHTISADDWAHRAVAFKPSTTPPNRLELEATTDNLLFEDSSGVLSLE